MNRLIELYDDYAEHTFCDFLLLIATDVEDSLLAAGAEPGTDYTYLDVYKLAVEVWKCSPKGGRRSGDDGL